MIKAVWECRHAGTLVRANRYLEREEWVPLSHIKQLCEAMIPKCEDCGREMNLLT